MDSLSDPLTWNGSASPIQSAAHHVLSGRRRGVWKSSEKTSPLLIVLIVFVSLLLAEESSYPTDENLRGFLVLEMRVNV